MKLFGRSRLREPEPPRPASMQDVQRLASHHDVVGLERVLDQSAQQYRAAYESEPFEVALAAARALATLGTPGLATLTERLDDESGAGIFASSGLGRSEDPAALALILAALEEPARRRYATSALAEREEPQAIETLRRLVHDAGGHVREDAALALAKRKDPMALDVLIGLATTKEPGLIDFVLDALGDYVDVRAVPALLEVMRRSPEDTARAGENRPQDRLLMPEESAQAYASTLRVSSDLDARNRAMQLASDRRRAWEALKHILGTDSELAQNLACESDLLYAVDELTRRLGPDDPNLPAHIGVFSGAAQRLRSGDAPAEVAETLRDYVRRTHGDTAWPVESLASRLEALTADQPSLLRAALGGRTTQDSG